MPIKGMINSYYDWLKEETTVHEHDNEYYEITSPYLDNSNDYIQIYAKTSNGIITLSDEGYYISMLESYGINIERQRLKMVEDICSSNGVKLDGKKLSISFSTEEKHSKITYQENIHRMIQTILRIDDMHLTSRTRVASYFYDDVIDFLERKEIGYSSDISVKGKSGLVNTYELLFQKSKTHNERFGKIINNLTKQSLTNTIFIWLDTQEMRKNPADLIVIANDENNMSEEAIRGFNEYGVKVIPWSEIDRNVNLLQ